MFLLPLTIATGQENQPQTAQVLPRKFPNARTNDVVQEEAGGLLYALLFVLRCICVAVSTAAIPQQLIPASMAHATANKKVTKVKATSHPTYKIQPLAKGYMPIRHVPCAEEACPLRPGPKGRPQDPEPDRRPRPKKTFKQHPAAYGHAAAEPSRFRDYIPWEVGR